MCHPVPQFHRTALHRSSLEGHMEILQKLLDSAATVDFRDRVRPNSASSCVLVGASGCVAVRTTAGLGTLQWGSAVPIMEMAPGRALPVQLKHGDLVGQGTDTG